jgi:hypothetical protein
MLREQGGQQAKIAGGDKVIAGGDKVIAGGDKAMPAIQGPLRQRRQCVIFAHRLFLQIFHLQVFSGFERVHDEG